MPPASRPCCRTCFRVVRGWYVCAADIRDMVAPRRERSSRSRSPPLATAREGEYAQGRSSPISLVCVGQLLDTRCVRGRSRFCPRVSGRRHASAHSARWCGAHREGPWRLGRRLPPGSRSGDRAARRFRPPQLPREEMHAAPPPPSRRAHGACRAPLSGERVSSCARALRVFEECENSDERLTTPWHDIGPYPRTQSEIRRRGWCANPELTIPTVLSPPSML